MLAPPGSGVRVYVDLANPAPTGSRVSGAPVRAGAAPPAEDAADSPAALFRTRCVRGRTWDGTALPAVAPRVRTVFDRRGGVGRGSRTPHAHTRRGGAPADLLSRPQRALQSPQEYARLGAVLRNLRPVSAVRHPGFGPQEALPATLDAFVTAQAAAVRAVAGDEPPVRLGRSAGGRVAQGVAERLEAEGAAPVAVVLVDTCPSGHDERSDTLSAMTSNMLHRATEFASADPDRLTAMAGCFELFGGWKPARLGWRPAGWRSRSRHRNPQAGAVVPSNPGAQLASAGRLVGCRV